MPWVGVVSGWHVDTLAHNPLGLLAAPIIGDYDHDGTVDDADYDAWQSAFGDSVSPTFGTDGNGDGIVDLADFVVWRDNSAITLWVPLARLD